MESQTLIDCWQYGISLLTNCDMITFLRLVQIRNGDSYMFVEIELSQNPQSLKELLFKTYSSIKKANNTTILWTGIKLSGSWNLYYVE